MSRARLTAGIALIFALGVLAGALGMQYYHQTNWAKGPRKHPTLEQKVAFIMERLDEDLDLTGEQAAKIRPIVEETEREVAVIKSRYYPDVRNLRDHGISRVRQLLGPEQQAKLDELMERMKKFHRKPPAAADGDKAARP